MLFIAYPLIEYQLVGSNKSTIISNVPAGCPVPAFPAVKLLLIDFLIIVFGITLPVSFTTLSVGIAFCAVANPAAGGLVFGVAINTTPASFIGAPLLLIIVKVAFT